MLVNLPTTVYRKDIFFPPLLYNACFVKIKSPFLCASSSVLSVQFQWPICLSLYHHTALTSSFITMLGMVSVLALFLAIFGSRYIYVNFGISLLIPQESLLGLIGITLNQYINLESLSNSGHGISLLLLR